MDPNKRRLYEIPLTTSLILWTKCSNVIKMKNTWTSKRNRRHLNVNDEFNKLWKWCSLYADERKTKNVRQNGWSVKVVRNLTTVIFINARVGWNCCECECSYVCVWYIMPYPTVANINKTNIVRLLFCVDHNINFPSSFCTFFCANQS